MEKQGIERFLRCGDRVDITEEMMNEALRRPDSFMYFGDNPDMFKTWAYGPTIMHRDSDALQRANAATIRAELAEIDPNNEEHEIGSSSHWLCGWVEVVTYRVRNDDGTPTDVMRYLADVSAYLEETYPCLDEEAWSNEEWDETVETMTFNYKGVTPDNVCDVLNWLDESGEMGGEFCRPDRMPTEEQVRSALVATGHGEPEDYCDCGGEPGDHEDDCETVRLRAYVPTK